MLDPYRVLGVSESASMDEIKKAYRTLSRKYHPDANINNPNKDQAEEVFKQVQQAYNQIVQERERQESGGFYRQDERQSSYGSDEDALKMQAAANYINSRHFQEAMNVLQSMSGRNSEWYYMRAVTHAGLGNNVNALADAREALRQNPNNTKYQMLVNQLEGGGSWYQNMGSGYGYERPTDSVGNCCWQCLLVNLCCNCCCCRC